MLPYLYGIRLDFSFLLKKWWWWAFLIDPITVIAFIFNVSQSGRSIISRYPRALILLNIDTVEESISLYLDSIVLYFAKGAKEEFVNGTCL